MTKFKKNKRFDIFFLLIFTSLEFELRDILTEGEWVVFENRVGRAVERAVHFTRLRYMNKLKKLGIGLEKNISLDGAIVNLSDRVVSGAEISLLKRGLNFVPAQKETDFLDIIKRFEGKFGEDRIDVRLKAKVVEVIERNFQLRDNLMRDEREALNKLKNDGNISILRADKGGKIVVVNKTDLDDKVRGLLNNGDYERLAVDPGMEIIKDLERMGRKCKKRGKFGENIGELFKIKMWKLSDLVVLPKIHKERPCSPIIMSFLSPLKPLRLFE